MSPRGISSILYSELYPIMQRRRWSPSQYHVRWMHGECIYSNNMHYGINIPFLLFPLYHHTVRHLIILSRITSQLIQEEPVPFHTLQLCQVMQSEFGLNCVSRSPPILMSQIINVTEIRFTAAVCHSLSEIGDH